MRLENLKVGQRVQAACKSKLFASENDSRFGVVTNFNDTRVWVQFDNGTEDYGLHEDVTLVEDIADSNAISVKEKLTRIENLVAEIKTILG